MIGFNRLGLLGRLGNQMFQYAALRGIAAKNGHNWMMPPPAEDYKKTLRITQRKAAIKAACMELSEGDVLLIAGKGHENYQEINGVKTPFDDYLIVGEICKQLF